MAGNGVLRLRSGSRAPLALSAAILAGLAGPARAAVVNQWVQFAPDDTVLLRAIEDDPANGCPTASLDGQPVPLASRGTVTAKAQAAQTYFPVLMCEASVSAWGHTAAMIGGVTLKMPVANPSRIVLIGDTGCRVTSSPDYAQACNDPTQFPLRFVATFAASFKPDLVVHVGDYFYREQPCPAAVPGCAGSPSYDNWDTWNADWFDPARNLLASAPLALSRGNHESCNRGARGWFRLLDPRPYDQNAVDCVGQTPPAEGTPGTRTSYVSRFDATPPYVVKAGPVALIMFDSSISDVSGPDTATRTQDGLTVPELYKAQLEPVFAALSGRSAFFVTHKSSFDIRRATLHGALSGGDGTQQSVFDAISPGGVPDPVRLIVSGHDHQFEAINFDEKRYAPQLVVGNGGTLLDNNSGTQPQTFVPDTETANQNQPYALAGLRRAPKITIQSDTDEARYGFTVLDAVADGYVLNAYDLAGRHLARCVVQLTARSLICPR